MAKAEKTTITETVVTETEGVQLTLTNEEAMTLARLLGWHVGGLGDHRRNLNSVHQALKTAVSSDYYELGVLGTSHQFNSIYLTE